MSLETVFSERARVRSDCGSAKEGGDLGHFGRGKMQPEFTHPPTNTNTTQHHPTPPPSFVGKMQPEFEKASFALAPGQLSDLVYTASGVHIIYRVE